MLSIFLFSLNKIVVPRGSLIFLSLYLYLFSIMQSQSVFYSALVASAKLIGAGLATIGVVGAGAGIGIIFSGLLLAASRNPGGEARFIQLALLGFALCEAMGLLAIMMAFLILYS